MSAERSTESIIDLLYGELSEEQEREMRAELAESPDLQAEYDQFDSMLGRVREAMPLEDVSPKIHASILEAARVAAERPADDRLMRRAAPEKQGFWKRVGGGQGSQIALVAAVLIAGLFVVRFVEKSDSPLHAPASDISAMREAAPAPVVEPVVAADPEGTATEGEGAAAPEEAPTPSGGEAIADQWSADNAPDDVFGGPADEKSAADSLRAELERSKELDGKIGAKAAVAKEPAPEPEPAAKPDPKPRKRSVGKKKEARPTRSAPSSARIDDLLDADVSTTAPRAAYADDAVAKGSTSSSSRRDQNLQGKSGLEVQAKEEADAETEQRAYRPAPGTISEVETYFRQGDYGGAVRAADNFLAKGSGSSSEKASAMFIKAQSLAKQGNTQSAERLLQQLKKAYPAWNSAQVEQQLSELQRRNAPKQQKKRKAKPKMDAPAEKEALEFYDAAE